MKYLTTIAPNPIDGYTIIKRINFQRSAESGIRQLCLMLAAAVEGRGNHIYVAKGEEEAQAKFKELLLLVPAGLIPVIDHEEMEIVISNGSRLKFNFAEVL